MTLCLYLDHDSGATALVRALRSEGVDVLTSREAGNERLPDEQQLAFASAHDRVLYSANVPDFARLHATWSRADRSHAGIILRVHQRTDVSLQKRGLVGMCQTLEPAELVNSIVFLENWLRQH